MAKPTDSAINFLLSDSYEGAANRGVDSWGAAAPQTPRDNGLNLAPPSAKIWGVGENLGRRRKSWPSALFERFQSFVDKYFCG